MRDETHLKKSELLKASTPMRESDLLKEYGIFKEVFNRTVQLIAIMGNDLTLIHANEALLEYLDMEMEDLKGIPYWELPMWKHSVELQNKVMFSMERIYLGKPVMFETTHKKSNGELRDIDFIIKPVMGDNGEVETLIAMGYDVTELKLAESALKRTEKELKMFFDHSINGFFINRLPEPVYIDRDNTDDIFDYVYQAEALFNYNNALLNQLEIDGSELDTKGILDLILNKDEDMRALWKQMVDDGYLVFERDVEINSKNKILDCTVLPIMEDNYTYIGSFGVINDITEKKRMERQLIYLATKDSLTGVNIRRHYLELAREMIDEAKAQAHEVAVIMIDIDNFKRVNDTYGHDVGDQVLIAMAKKCEAVIGDEGYFGRMGGEEFSAVIHSQNRDAFDKAEEIRRELENLEVDLEGEILKFTVSIGYVDVKGSMGLEEALKQSDKALYEAKDSGKNKVVRV